MTYLVWRQHRNQVLVGGIGLAALTVLLLVTGVTMEHTYTSALHSCGASASCDDLGGIFSNYGAVFDVVALTMAVPALLGLFWGAPLLAREIEDGTHKLAWTQSVTRRRWLSVKTAWVIGAAAVWAGSITALVTWWSGPVNSVNQFRFQLGHFDTQGIVPIGYALFAVALGITTGALLGRTLPALAATLTVFVGVRFAIDYGLRPHYLPAVTASAPIGTPPAIPSGSWTMSTTVLDPAGHATDGLRFTPDLIPAACRGLFGQGPRQMLSCLGAHGYRQVVAYQPAGRFWTHQFIETGIYAALAACLVALAFRVVARLGA